MEASEVISILKRVVRDIVPLESRKYHDLFQGECTSGRYFMDDAILSSCSLSEIEKISNQILLDIKTKAESELSLILDGDKFSEVIEQIFESTNLHSGSTARIVLNFEALESWASTYISITEEYKLYKFQEDVRESLALTFTNNHDILEEVLNNKNIFSKGSIDLGGEIIDMLSEYTEENMEKLDSLIKQQVVNVVAVRPNQLNYQWYKILNNKELKIQRYDELKQHELYAHLF